MVLEHVKVVNMFTVFLMTHHESYQCSGSSISLQPLQVKKPYIQTRVNIKPLLVSWKIGFMREYSPTRGRNYAKPVLQKKEK